MKKWRSFRMERFNGIQIAAACNSEVVSRIVVLDRAVEREPGSLFSSSCVSLLFDRKVKSRGYTKNPFETINQSLSLSLLEIVRMIFLLRCELTFLIITRGREGSLLAAD